MEYDGLNVIIYPIARQEHFPLDADSVFESYADALAYARGGSRGEDYETTAHLGQIISVVEDDESGNTSVKVYKIVVATPADIENDTPEVWGLSLIGEGGGGGDGKVKDVQFNSTTFLNEETGIANFVSDEIVVNNDGKLHIKKIVNAETEILIE